jgi:hypothetical protein
MAIRAALLCVLLCALGAASESATTPRSTSAVATQIGARMCIASGASVNVTVHGAAGAGVHTFRGAAAWRFFTPAARNFETQCTEWLARAHESVQPVPPGGAVLQIPDDSEPIFWYIGLTNNDCRANVSDMAYTVDVLDDSVFSEAIACMGLSERAFSELWTEWLAIRNASFLDVPHVSVLGIVACYAATATAVGLAVSFYVTAHRGVTVKSKLISRYAFISCLAVATAYFLLATGNFGYQFVYRVDNAWVSADTFLESTVLTNAVATYVYAIPLARFVSRAIAMTVTMHCIALYVNESDVSVTMLTATSAAMQLMATLILTPSKWIIVFISWVTAAMAFVRMRGLTKTRTHALPAMFVLWLLDYVVWCATDAIHTTPVAASIVSHALIDVASFCCVPLALRSGAYKRAVPRDLQVLELDE